MTQSRNPNDPGERGHASAHLAERSEAPGGQKSPSNQEGDTLDLDGLEKVARIVPSWADTTWELDQAASTDAFEVRVALDGDVDGDTGRHLVTGGNLVALLPDVLGDGDLAKYVSTFDPPTVRHLIQLARSSSPKGDVNRELLGHLKFAVKLLGAFGGTAQIEAMRTAIAKAEATLSAPTPSEREKVLLRRAREYVADALEAYEHTDGRELLTEIDAYLSTPSEDQQAQSSTQGAG